MFNVAKADGTLMLLQWVSPFDALKWLRYYTEQYAAGTPYPNGKGVYPEAGFHIVKR